MPREGFSPASGGGVKVKLPAWARDVLRSLLAEMATLLDAEEPDLPRDATADPLEAMTGLGVAAPPRPDDPALLRLRPDAYGADVEAGRAAAEFRRLAGADLAELQRARIATMRELLAGGDRIELDAEQADAWLGAFNDLRLVVGTRLDIRDDTPPEPFPADDPRAALFEVYQLLTHLQSDLLVALGAPSEF